MMITLNKVFLNQNLYAENYTLEMRQFGPNKVKLFGVVIYMQFILDHTREYMLNSM